MFSKILAITAYAFALVGGAPPSLQAPMADCSLNTHSSAMHGYLEPGNYMIYNQATGKDRLATFNPGEPVLVLPGDVPPHFVTWKVRQAEGHRSQYYITNVGTNSGGNLNDDVVTTTPGSGTRLTLTPIEDGFRIHAQLKDDDQVWEVCEDDQGLRRVHIDPIEEVPGQVWKFVPVY
ncbi:hypothetical protein GGX14DRAFT_440405 [Mycena pura]|uniref:Ricin B lectin domain-containing protein n=1 Tax=Mycena pura TaxID=153505 RepID=A0AAD6YFI9_9AGAR|nr:hypothetical protein GGX14DRAFT_440405 [Mycena pura]